VSERAAYVELGDERVDLRLLAHRFVFHRLQFRLETFDVFASAATVLRRQSGIVVCNNNNKNHTLPMIVTDARARQLALVVTLAMLLCLINCRFIIIIINCVPPTPGR